MYATNSTRLTECERKKNEKKARERRDSERDRLYYHLRRSKYDLWDVTISNLRIVRTHDSPKIDR